MQFCSTKHDEGTWRMSEWETEGEDVKIKHASPYLCTMLLLDKNISLAFKCLVGWVYCQFSFYIYIAHTNWALRKFTFLFSLPRSARQHLIVEASLNKLKWWSTCYIHFFLIIILNIIVVFFMEAEEWEILWLIEDEKGKLCG